MVRVPMSRKNVSELSVMPLLQFCDYFVACLKFADVHCYEFLRFWVHQDEADVVVEEFVEIQVGDQGVVVAGVRVEFIFRVIWKKGVGAALLEVPA